MEKLLVLPNARGNVNIPSIRGDLYFAKKKIRKNKQVKFGDC